MHLGKEIKTHFQIFSFLGGTPSFLIISILSSADHEVWPQMFSRCLMECVLEENNCILFCAQIQLCYLYYREKKPNKWDYSMFSTV